MGWRREGHILIPSAIEEAHEGEVLWGLNLTIEYGLSAIIKVLISQTFSAYYEGLMVILPRHCPRWSY